MRWLVALLLPVVGCLAALTAAAQLRPLRPDLVVSEASVTPQRVGVGEEFTYTVTVKNIGGAPCNSITFQLVGADDLSEPVRGVPESPIRCEREICTGSVQFVLLPGHSVQAKFVHLARTVGLHGPATATVDPNNVCSEAAERNNTATSPTVQIIERPKLSLSATRPTPTTIEQSSGIYTAIITNGGRGVATDVVLTFPQSGGLFFEVTSAHFGLPPASGAAPGRDLPINPPVQVGTSKSRTVLVRLGPGESFHAGISSEACRNVRHAQSLTVSTVDDISTDNHAVVLQRSCSTGTTP
jgi:hypothetical protein